MNIEAVIQQDIALQCPKPWVQYFIANIEYMNEYKEIGKLELGKNRKVPIGTPKKEKRKRTDNGGNPLQYVTIEKKTDGNNSNNEKYNWIIGL